MYIHPLAPAFWPLDKQLQEMMMKFVPPGQPGWEDPRCIPEIAKVDMPALPPWPVPSVVLGDSDAQG